MKNNCFLSFILVQLKQKGPKSTLLYSWKAWSNQCWTLLFMFVMYNCATEALKLNSVNAIQRRMMFYHAAFAMFTLRMKLSLHDMAVQIWNCSVYSVFLAVVVEHRWHTQIYLAVLNSPWIHIEQSQNKWWCWWKSWGSKKQTKAATCAACWTGWQSVYSGSIKMVQFKAIMTASIFERCLQCRTSPHVQHVSMSRICVMARTINNRVV